MTQVTERVFQCKNPDCDNRRLYTESDLEKRNWLPNGELETLLVTECPSCCWDFTEVSD